MKMLGGPIGGVLGGLIGAALWAAVTHFSGWEIGWIAVAIGGLVGLGVQIGTGRQGGIGPAGTAAIIALAAVLLGKWATVRIELSAYLAADESTLRVIADVILAENEEAGRPVHMPRQDLAETVQELYPPRIWSEARQRWAAMAPQEQDALRELPALANTQIWLIWLSDEIVAEYGQRGRAVDWPQGWNVDIAWREAHYPPEVWSESVARWTALSAQEQEAYKASVTRRLRQMMAFGEQELLTGELLQRFGLFDLLWIALAVGTAAKMAAARLDDGMPQPPPPPAPVLAD